MKTWVIRGLFWGIAMVILTTFLFPWLDNEPMQLSRIWVRALIFIPMGLAMFFGLDRMQKEK